MSDDKYPEESGRRRFVKGVVGGAALAGVGVTGSVTINSATTSPGAGGGATQAYAIKRIDGPAPRGMPQIPVEIQSDGTIKGVWPDVTEENQGGITVQIAETPDYKGSGVTYSSDWYQYCGVESYQGIEPGFESDNLFKSDASPAYDWQTEVYEQGDPLNIEDFGDYQSWGNGIGESGIGKPATGVWRSEDTENTIPIQIIRSELVEQAAQDDPWLQASTDQGVIAWLNKCTHFCCVPGYKQTTNAAKFGAEDDVYCPCHQSVYDPFAVEQTLFTARPRPDD